MIKELITDREKLSERSKEFDIGKESELAVQILKDLGDTLNSLEDRLFLTAKEIGYDKRIFAVKFNGETDVFMNPAFKVKDKLILFREKDVITNKEYFMPRYTEVSLVFQDFAGNTKGFKFNEGASIIISQAMNLLDGILDSDIGLEVIPEFDEAPEEEKQEVLSAYLSSISEAAKQFNEDLSTDEETKETWNAAKFITSFAEGNIEIEKKELSNRKKKQLNKILKMFKKKGIKI